ncbi:hypothetical protein BY996DRAFT_6451731 [Phakopsora pachyrhizi]|nr:hypothetical protein BY996DRAFT_6451731 [Phakopsora pachyrhizi]
MRWVLTPVTNLSSELSSKQSAIRVLHLVGAGASESNLGRSHFKISSWLV